MKLILNKYTLIMFNAQFVISDVMLFSGIVRNYLEFIFLFSAMRNCIIYKTGTSMNVSCNIY